VLDNAYSGNVIDVCPVGALTEQDFRFKARVWYLASAPSVCNGCAQGCNVDVHYVLDRPHLDGGARIMRLKPRYNPDVNQWWMCDEGRFGFHWIDRERVTRVRHRGVESNWEQAVDAVAAALAPPGVRLGVIASSGLSTEELFLIREVLQHRLGARVTSAVPMPPGHGDDFLRKADRSPNTAGAAMLGLTGPDVPSLDDILADARAGRIDTLWVFGIDLAALIGDAELEALSRALTLLIYAGTNENRTAVTADWVLPTAAYLEKDGTFVNCHGRIQRIGRAFAPVADSREDWAVLLELARRLELPLPWHTPQDIFLAMAQTTAALDGLTYEAIGTRGASIRP
jgi:NADH-quinone oxidoreductase subunit G